MRLLPERPLRPVSRARARDALRASPGVNGPAGAGACPSYPPQTDWSNLMTEPVIMPLSLEATD